MVLTMCRAMAGTNVHQEIVMLPGDTTHLTTVGTTGQCGSTQTSSEVVDLSAEELFVIVSCYINDCDNY